MDKERVEISRRLHEAQDALAHHLDLFGDTLAKKQGYKSPGGMEAIYYYLVRKFGWLPRDVRAMSSEDMRFVLTEEMEGWTAPKPARSK